MIIIKVNSDNAVIAYHKQAEKLTDEQKEGSIEVNAIPEIEQREGKRGILFYDSTTEEVYVEYIDRPLTEEEKIQQLEADNAELWYQVMLLGGNS